MRVTLYDIDAHLAHRHAQIRHDYSPRRRPRRHLSLPKVSMLARLPKVRFARPTATA